MKTPPNQIDLATLATRLPTGSPGERVDAALAIWEAAGKRLADLEARAVHIATPRQADSDYARIMQGIEFPAGTVSLEVFLAKTVPNKFHKSQRKDIFREFLAVHNPAVPRGVGEFSVIESQGISEPFVQGFAFIFRRWLETYKAEERKSFQKGRSESGSLVRWGAKWVKDALAGESAQTFEMLVENTKRHTGNDRELAQKRAQGLIAAGLIVKVDRKLYGIPNPKKKPTNKK